jgi:ribosomal-protein-alanine N-acetyltransferase
MKVFVETERLILREMGNDDLEGMFALDSNAIVHKFLGGKPIKTKVEAQKHIDYIRMQYDTYGIGRWAVIEKTTGEFIGWSGLKLNFENEMNGYRNFIDVGYRLIPKYWGKGYATESAKAAIDYGFEKKEYKAIYGLAELDYKASRNILQKLGLTHIEDFYYEPEKASLAWYEINKNT